MLSVLLLPLLAGAPAVPAVAAHDVPPIEIWINNDRYFRPGDRAKVQVRTREDGYLLVLHADPDGHLRVLFPIDPSDDNFVRGGRKYEIRGRGGRESFSVDVSSGRGTVYAAVSHDPYRFDGYILGDHWDYRALAPNRLPREPETELTELVRQMAQGNFDYDILSYDVVERVVYASDYSYPPSYFYGPSLYDPWCSGFSFEFGCAGPFSSSRFAVSGQFFFGRRFRRFDSPFVFVFDPFFDPFFFDPFFFSGPFIHRAFFVDPFFPRPFIHRAFFVDPFFPRPFFHQGAFGDPFFHRPVFFRPRDGAPVPFRDRRNDFRRPVNAATPTPWRARGVATATPVRRVVEQRVTELRSEQPARRPVADSRRSFESRTIEARRAREPDRAPVPRQLTTDARRGDWPVDVSPRRARPEVQRDLPTEVRPESSDREWLRGEPKRVVAERSVVTDRPDREFDSRRADDRPSPPPQSDRYSGDRGDDRGYDRRGDVGDRGDRGDQGDRGDRGGGQVERQGPPPQSAPSDRGRGYNGGGRDAGGRRR